MPAGQGGVSSYQAGQWIAGLLDVPLYVALAASNPLFGDPLAIEFIGGSYARQLGTFVSSGPTSVQSIAQVQFHGLPLDSVVAGVMVFDAPRNGNLVAAYAYDAPVQLGTGGKYTVAAGELEIGVDVSLV